MGVIGTGDRGYRAVRQSDSRYNYDITIDSYDVSKMGQQQAGDRDDSYSRPFTGHDPAHGRGQEVIKVSWASGFALGGVRNLTGRDGSGRVKRLCNLGFGTGRPDST